MALLHTILTKLQVNKFTVNLRKCEWAVKETDWLGYCLTSIQQKPWKKKIKAVLRMQPPTSLILLHDVHHTEGKPVAYHSKKLNSAQINYPTIYEELLCIFSIQCEFSSMLLSAELHVHTDKKIMELHYVEGHAM
jgi:hypothetical protein